MTNIVMTVREGRDMIEIVSITVAGIPLEITYANIPLERLIGLIAHGVRVEVVER